MTTLTLLVASTPPTPELPAPPRGAGWYRGDLHAHTVHSDGAWQGADLLAAADAFGLDFVTLSDRNTISGLPEFEQMARPGPATICAIEQGHLYLSDEPQIELVGHGHNGARAMIGDELPAGDAIISACWKGCALTDQVRLIVWHSDVPA